MNTTSPAPVVVVTTEKKRRKGLIWVAGGMALLVGGSTFALWSATDLFTGGTIQAGDFNLVLAEDMTFWDVSGDRNDGGETVIGTDGVQAGHEIADIDTWRIVPGDKVAASFSADITLEGDNLVGLLSVDGLGSNDLINTAMTYTYEIYQDGVLLVTETALPKDDDAALVYLAAPETGQLNGTPDADGTTVFAMTNTTEDFTVVIYGEFNEETADQDQVTVADTLADLTLRLEQKRDTSINFA